MAMTLRLTPQEDAALTLLAQSQGISKQEAATRAILEKAARNIAHDELTTLATQTCQDYAALSKRIKNARPENHNSTQYSRRT